MTNEYPPRSAKIALVLTAIVWIATVVGLGIHLNKIEARPTPSAPAPATAQ